MEHLHFPHQLTCRPEAIDLGTVIFGIANAIQAVTKGLN